MDKMSVIDPEDMIFPRRWQMVMMLVSGVAIAYALRVNISIAAVKMESSLDWTGTQKGLVFSAFYIGYALGQMPSAFMTHWYGAKHLFGGSIAVTSVLTLFFPAVIKYNFGLGIFMRVVIGLTASATFPSCYYFYKSWIPVNEKTLMVSTIMSGVYLGEIVCFSLCGFLAQTPMTLLGHSVGGWPSCFWSFSLVGLLWYPLWLVYGYEKPEDHPNINPKEIALIRSGKVYNTVAAFDKEQEDELEKDLPTAVLNPIDPNQLGSESLGSANGGNVVALTPWAIRPMSPELTHRKFVTSGVTADGSVLETPLLATGESGRLREDSVACSIIDDTADNEKEVARRIPWGYFFRDSVSLTLLFAYFVMSWIGFMMLSEIPSFLTDQLDFEIEEAGLISVLPYFAQFVSSLGFGQLFGYFQRDFGWTTYRVRQVAQFICFSGSGICLVICGFMTNVGAAIFFLVFALFMFGATQSGLACAFLDVTPNYSCSLNSLANLVGAIAGILAPLVVTLFTTIFPGPAGWQLVFIFTAGLCVIALYFWRKYQTSDVVPLLNSPRPKKTVAYKEWFPWFRI